MQCAWSTWQKPSYADFRSIKRFKKWLKYCYEGDLSLRFEVTKQKEKSRKSEGWSNKQHGMFHVNLRPFPHLSAREKYHRLADFRRPSTLFKPLIFAEKRNMRLTN